MDNTLTLGKRVFSAGIAAATILWAVGVAAFAVPQTANAASAGDLVTGSLPAVYYVGHDGMRYTFPNSNTYFTWYDDFNSVDTISDSALAEIELAGNVVYRPGSRWIKITTNPRTYAVSTNGNIHWIETEDVASDFAGSDWNQSIDDVADVFFTDYSEGSSLMSATVFDGMMYMDGSDHYVAWGGEKRLVSSTGRDANDMESRFFLDGSGIDDSSLSSGDDITAYVCDLLDAAQTGCDETPAATGDVTVSVSSSTAASATVPKGANSVKMFSFDLKAGSEDANVNIIALSMNGIGATTNVSNVYLYEGSTRLTEARSVNASTRKATFGSLNLDIDAGKTRTLTARVELSSSASAGDQVQFSIASASDVTTDGGDVGGSFPVSGNAFTVANVSVGEIDITKNGTITNPSLGANDAVIGQFKIVANSEDASIEEITLKIDDAGDHSDFKLWDGSTLLDQGEEIGGDLVLFDLSSSPFTITEGNNDIFKVSADIGGKASDAVKVHVDNAADVVAVGGDYGFGMTVDIDDASGYDGSSCTSTSGKCSYSTVQGGDVTFAFSGPSAGSVLTNSQDQVLMEFTLTSVQSITVKDLDIIVYADDDGDNDPFDAVDDDAGNADGDADGLVNTSTEANITDIKIVNADTGAVLMGPLELDALTDAASADDADQTIDFTDDFNLAAGETLTLQVVVDVDDSITSGTELGAAIDISGFVAEDSNGDTLTNSTDVVPTSDITGHAQEATAASLTIALASTPGDVTVVQGATGKEVQAFSFITGSAGEVNISGINMTVYAHDASTGTFQKGDCTSGDQCATRDVDVNDFIESCSIYDSAGSLLDGPTSPAANGQTINFSDVNWSLAESTSERLSVKCNIANPSQANDVYFAFDLDDVSEDVTAEDGEGTDVDPTSDDPNGGTSPTNVVTVAASGSIAITVDSSSPDADFLITGSSDNHVATFRFTATNEDFVVSKLVVQEEASEDITGTAGAYANNIAQVTLEYTNSAGATETKSATMASNKATFTGMDIAVNAGSNAKVKAYVDVPSSDRNAGGAATSNERVELGLSATSGDFKAVSSDSGTTDSAADDLETGKTFVVKETAPTITLSSASPSGTGFIPGDQEVLRFNVAANANEDVIIDELLFEMSATDNGSGTWFRCDNAGAKMTAGDVDLYNLSTDGTSTAVQASGDVSMLASDAAACDTTANTNAGENVKFWHFDLTSPETIPAGSTHTFALYFDSSGADSSNDDSIQFKLPVDPVLAVGSFIDTTTINEGAAFAVTDTTLTVTSGTAFSAGDIVCLTTGTCAAGDEKALVTAKSTNDLTLVRGYLGSTPVSIADGSNADRLPSTFYWEDDGDSSTDNTGDNWGSYLIDSLPVTGGAMGF